MWASLPAGVSPRHPRAWAPLLRPQRLLRPLCSGGVGLAEFSLHLEVLLPTEPAALRLALCAEGAPPLLIALSDLTAVGLVGGVCLFVSYAWNLLSFWGVWVHFCKHLLWTVRATVSPVSALPPLLRTSCSDLSHGSLMPFPAFGSFLRCVSHCGQFIALPFKLTNLFPEMSNLL